MAIQIKSYNQILGEMLRKMIAETPLNDINKGSALLSLLEAAAQIDFENNASVLNLLELLSIDAIKNNDLDVRAADFGLSRTAAQKASGFVTITDSSITKRSTGLYQVKPAPISGQTTLFVNNASGWSPTGNLFIGRGTQNFEGPIPYTTITNNISFYTITLGSALQKDHLISDVVIDAQGTTDRLITAGTTVQIPANNQNPAIDYTILRDAVIPAGEDTVENVNIIAALAGSMSNAGINTITNFVTVPFTGATVLNPIALTNGRDVESDDDLRERLKSYSSTLARGTQSAILNAIIGVSDPDDAKQVASAVVTEPPKIGDPSIIYIDDGSGFQPSFTGQSVDNLLSNANGDEEFLQLANYPLPRPQVINTADGPFELTDGMIFSVIVDGVEESVTFSTSDFVNIAAARLSEIIIAINDQSTANNLSFLATLTADSSRMLIYPTAHDTEVIQVAPLRSTDNELLYANSKFKFPTNEYSYIRLYQNNVLLHEKQKAASLLTTTFGNWNITASGNIIISVDGTPVQDQTFDTSDFGGLPFATLTLSDWVAAFNRKFAGITATATSSDRMQITSNLEGASSSLEVTGGSYLDKWFSNQPTSASGQNPDFQLNRQTGNLRILTDIAPGDSITAGIEDAKGSVLSATTITGNFNVSADSNSRPAEVVMMADSDNVAPRTGVGLAVGNIITVSDQGSNVMRLMSSSLSSFDTIQPGDYLYIADRGGAPWLASANTGLFKVIAKGEHTVAGTDSYIEVHNTTIVAGSHTVLDSADIQAFKADTYPQLWKGSFTTTPAAASLQNIVDTINNKLVNVKASIFKTNSVKVTSTTEEDGSFATPISAGRASLIIDTQGEEQRGNPSHIANRTSSKDAFSFFKRTTPTATDADGVTGKQVWLDRVTYTDIKGSLTDTSVPGVEFIDTYGESLQSTGNLTSANVDYDDIYNATGGANRGQYRSIRDKLSGDRIGTQYELPTTLMDYVNGDTFNLARPVGISSEDSIVFIIDQDAVNKTIDIPMSRRGLINSSFPATSLSFSADDADNEAGITFGTLQVWSKTTNNTEFENYATWMRARNWYVSGGATSGGGAFILRSKEFGPHGENFRFRIEYPSLADQDNTISHTNDPDFSLVTYKFGSDTAKSIGLTAGDQFTVTSLGGDDYRYTFTGIGVDLSTVLVGDVVSILADSGVSSANRGQFRIKNINIPSKYIDIRNPNGAVTVAGTPEVTDVTTIADVIGSQTVSTVSSVLAEAAIADDDFFTLNDSAGVVAVVYDKNSSVSAPSAYGANRIIKVTLSGGESATTVASLTAGVIEADPEFSASAVGTTITITNTDNGAFAVAADATGPYAAQATGFSFAGTAGTANVSLDGKYFILRDINGTVAFWYNISGVTPEPLHGANRAVQITTVLAGDSANTIATKTAVVVNAEVTLNAVAALNVVTVTDANNGSRAAASAGTSGFTVAEVTNGSDGTFETISTPTSFLVFALLNTSVTDIVSKINESSVIDAAESDGTNPIVKATRDEEYTPAGPGNYSLSLSYGHDPDPSSNLHGYVSFYDGINWVKSFSNSNPHFTLKKTMTLQGVAPTAYNVTSAPNPNSATLGEYFKLVPVTLNNIHHHFTHKALSQLPIVANVDISNKIRRVQVKSKLLGSTGAVEVVGGNANNIEFSTSGESQITPGLTKNFLKVKTAAFPVTLTKGDVVEVRNDTASKRYSRLLTSDTIDVVKGTGTNVEYRWNPKITFGAVNIAITDVSATYSRPAGTIWRWTHNGSVSVLLTARVGDLLNAYGTLTGWNSGNKSKVTGDGNIAGHPIIAVNSASLYVDVINPDGVAMASTAIGAGTVAIMPTPIIPWSLKHAATTQVVQVVLAAPFGTATVTTATQHKLREGDTFILADNGIAQTATVATVTSHTTFTFTDTSGSPANTYVKGNVIRSGRTPTRYKIEQLGFNDLCRLSYVDGDAPGFVDCGVAVDDTLVLSGDTFKSNNAGRFKILGVDNSSIIYKAPDSTEELNTIIPFNNLQTSVTWTANFDEVTGSIGAFKNVSVGDWVKKAGDDETLFVQVLNTLNSLNVPVAPSIATKLLLGDVYRGTTSTSLGVTYDQNSDVGKGVYLADMGDVSVFEGDAVTLGDTLFIDNFSNASWFSNLNSGSFTITQIGTNATNYKPFVRITNSAAENQSNRAISVNEQGFFIIEGENNKYSSVRVVDHTAVDSFDSNYRAIFMTPATRSYKISQSNGSKIVPMGKLQYSTDVVTGVDGYTYYTGLLRTVQRIIDGFEPDLATYPGRRAIGGIIELLPPLIRRVSISLEVTTNEGVNLNEIANDIKSAIINYIDGLGVGEDVILSEIIVKVMAITGVAAATFSVPSPSEERISISDVEKAFAEPSDISIA